MKSVGAIDLIIVIRLAVVHRYVGQQQRCEQAAVYWSTELYRGNACAPDSLCFVINRYNSLTDFTALYIHFERGLSV